MKIKFLSIIGFICLMLVTLTNCSKVRAGNVGIKVYLLGSSKGIDHEVLGVGKYWIGMNEELYIFPTFKQNYVWTQDITEGSKTDESITFQTAEGMTVGADIGITYQLNEEKISIIFQKYRRGVDEITDTFLRNKVRDTFNIVASKYPVESVYGKGKAKLIDEVNEIIKSDLSDEGIIVERIYLIGEFRLPEQVVKALNKKIEATQRAEQREYELRESEAEAKKKIAQAKGESESMLIKVEAEAKSNQLKLSTINNLLISYEIVLNERKAIEKWDGKLPNNTNGIPLLKLLNK